MNCTPKQRLSTDALNDGELGSPIPAQVPIRLLQLRGTELGMKFLALYSRSSYFLKLMIGAAKGKSHKHGSREALRVLLCLVVSFLLARICAEAALAPPDHSIRVSPIAASEKIGRITKYWHHTALAFVITSKGVSNGFRSGECLRNNLVTGTQATTLLVGRPHPPLVAITTLLTNFEMNLPFVYQSPSMRRLPQFRTP